MSAFGTTRTFRNSDSLLGVGMAACGGLPRCLLLHPLSGEKRTSNAQKEPFRF